MTKTLNKLFFDPHFSAHKKSFCGQLLVVRDCPRRDSRIMKVTHPGLAEYRFQLFSRTVLFSARRHVRKREGVPCYLAHCAVGVVNTVRSTVRFKLEQKLAAEPELERELELDLELELQL